MTYPALLTAFLNSSLKNGYRPCQQSYHEILVQLLVLIIRLKKNNNNTQNSYFRIKSLLQTSQFLSLLAKLFDNKILSLLVKSDHTTILI